MSLLDNNGLTYFWGKIKSYVASVLPVDFTGASSSAAGAHGLVPAPTTADVGKFLTAEGSWRDGGRPMVVLSYGNSTWDDFIDAYNNHIIVYCKASSGSNPGSGAQTRQAFMAYVNADPPTEVEFQYYRSVSSHTDSQQGDQVFIYKLNKTSGWSVTTRNAFSKVVAGTNMTSSYSNGTITLSATDANVTQTPVNADANYEILFSGTADNTEHTEGVGKYSGAIVNPSKNAFTFGARASNYTVGEYSHAEGYSAIASGNYSHTEGSNTTASGNYSHAEGSWSTASGNYSHAEGKGVVASGYQSHAEGSNTIANHGNQHVFGEYNIADDSSATAANRGNYVEIVGNGITTNARSNARTLDWSGNEVLAGKLTVGAAPTTNMDVATKKYVDDADAVINSSLAQLDTKTSEIAKVITASGTYSIGANSSVTISITANIPSGYTAVMGYISATGNADVFMRFLDLSAMEVGLINKGTSAQNNKTIGVKVLCIKTSLL